MRHSGHWIKVDAPLPEFAMTISPFRTRAALLGLLVTIAACATSSVASGASDENTINFGGYERHYVVHKPAGIRSEEHTSELQSLMRISYAVFCLKKKQTLQYILPQRYNRYNN